MFQLKYPLFRLDDIASPCYQLLLSTENMTSPFLPALSHLNIVICTFVTASKNDTLLALKGLKHPQKYEQWKTWLDWSLTRSVSLIPWTWAGGTEVNKRRATRWRAFVIWYARDSLAPASYARALRFNTNATKIRNLKKTTTTTNQFSFEIQFVTVHSASE